mmetsp:Transcript_119771/g.284567  ORF Transcript_119771/g.284567 Transcript_119771/m.284567 type:complete len:334 (-) Transcript_119771:781-1782(-)
MPQLRSHIARQAVQALQNLGDGASVGESVMLLWSLGGGCARTDDGLGNAGEAIHSHHILVRACEPAPTSGCLRQSANRSWASAAQTRPREDRAHSVPLRTYRDVGQVLFHLVRKLQQQIPDLLDSLPDHEALLRLSRTLHLLQALEKLVNRQGTVPFVQQIEDHLAVILLETQKLQLCCDLFGLESILELFQCKGPRGVLIHDGEELSESLHKTLLILILLRQQGLLVLLGVAQRIFHNYGSHQIHKHDDGHRNIRVEEGPASTNVTLQRSSDAIPRVEREDLDQRVHPCPNTASALDKHLQGFHLVGGDVSGLQCGSMCSLHPRADEHDSEN